MIEKVVITCSECARYNRVSKTNKLTIQRSNDFNQNEKRVENLYFTERLVNQRIDLKRTTDLHIRFGNAFYGKLKTLSTILYLKRTYRGQKNKLAK